MSATAPAPAPAQDAPRGNGVRSRIRSLLRQNESGLIGILFLVSLIAAIAVPAFRSSGNPTQILDNSSLVVIVAVGEALVIMARQIDLSVAAILGLAAYLIGSWWATSGSAVRSSAWCSRSVSARCSACSTGC